MEKILEALEQELKAAFTACGYEEKFAKVVLSNRPDLCEYQWQLPRHIKRNLSTLQMQW